MWSVIRIPTKIFIVLSSMSVSVGIPMQRAATLHSLFLQYNIAPRTKER